MIKNLHQVTMLRGCEQEQPIFFKYSILNLRYFSFIGSTNLHKTLSQAVVWQMSADKKEED